MKRFFKRAIFCALAMFPISAVAFAAAQEKQKPTSPVSKEKKVKSASTAECFTA